MLAERDDDRPRAAASQLLGARERVGGPADLAAERLGQLARVRLDDRRAGGERRDERRARRVDHRLRALLGAGRGEDPVAVLGGPGGTEPDSTAHSTAAARAATSPCSASHSSAASSGPGSESSVVCPWPRETTATVRRDSPPSGESAWGRPAASRSARTASPVGPPAGPHTSAAAELLQRARDVDPLAARARVHAPDPVGLAPLDVLELVGDVEGGVERDREHHAPDRVAYARHRRAVM